MLQHVANASVPVAGFSLAQVAGLPWWVQLALSIGGLVVSFFAARSTGGGK